MWPATAFLVARGSIQEKPSSLKFSPTSLLFLLEERFSMWDREVSLCHFLLTLQFKLQKSGRCNKLAS